MIIIKKYLLEECVRSGKPDSTTTAVMTANDEYDKDDDDGDDDEDDEDDDEDDDEFNPGDFGHPLNADGTPRQAQRIEGYCVSCKTLRVFDGFIRIAESGNSLVNGACPVCNTRMSKTLER
mgnify:CR=1 FL=1